jgi:hypothetical protein
VTEWRDGWRDEGRAEGEVKGEAKMLVRLAETKYGALPGWALHRIESADANQLLVWGERILTAKSLEEIFE